jgi:hypothetical protein
MKRIILFSLITLSCLAYVNAQTSQTGASVRERAKTAVAGINSTVGLHGNQFVDADHAYIDYYTRLDALNAQKASLSAVDYQTQLTALQTTCNSKIASLLDANQAKSLQLHPQLNKGN